jgi:hypothetical protein
MSPLPIGPIFLCALNVFWLACFVPAAEQYDQGISMSRAVDSVTGSNIDSQLKDSFTYGFAIAEVAGLNLTKPLNDPRLCSLIAEPLEPSVERALTPILLVNDQLEH